MLAKGTRVEIHSAHDRWMRGDRFGEITGYGHKHQYVDASDKTLREVCHYIVRLDKSGHTTQFHPDNVSAID